MVKSIKNISTNINIPTGTKELIFKLDIPEAQPFIDTGIMHCGLSTCPKDYKVDRFYVCKHQLIFIIKGSLYFQDINEFNCKAEEGELVFFPISHQQHYWTKEKTEILWFHLHGMALWKNIETHLICNCKSKWSKQLYNASIEFLKETETPRSDSSELVLNYARIICKYLEREINGSRIVEKITAEERELNRLWNIVGKDLSRDWTVKDLADLIYTSPAQLHRMVKGITKTTPMQAVRHLRLKKARELLFSTDRSLANIATEVGYETAFALSKSFKKHFSITPAEVRKQQ